MTNFLTVLAALAFSRVGLIIACLFVGGWLVVRGIDRRIARAFNGAGVQYGPRIAYPVATYGLDEDTETWMPFPSDEFIDRLAAEVDAAGRVEFERQVLADIDRLPTKEIAS